MAYNTKVGLEFVARDRSQAGVRSFERGITKISRQLLAVAGIGGGLYMFKKAFTSVIDAYKVQEKAELDLRAALRNTGETRKSVMADMKSFAATMQKQTIYGDELILSQMAYAKNLGVTTDKLKEATRAAIGLAAKYRLDLRTSMMLIGRASQGQTQMLTRYGIVLEESLSNQEKFNRVLQIGSDAFSLAQAETNTLSGRLEQLSNRWGDIKEKIAGKGGVVSALNDLLDVIDRNESVWSKFFESQISGLAEITSGFEGLRIVIKHYFDDIKNGQAAISKYSMTPGGFIPGPPPAKKGITFGGGAGGRFSGRGAGGAWGQQYVPMTSGLDLEAIRANRAAAKAELEQAKKFREAVNERIIEYKKEAQKRLQIMAQMYEDMEQKGEAYKQIRIKLLNFEVDKYRQLGIDEVLIEQWKQDQILKIQKESSKKKIEEMNALQQMRMQLEYDFNNFSQYSAKMMTQAAVDVEYAMSDAFYRMIAEGATWRDTMSAFFADVARAFSRMAADMTAHAVMAGIFGGFNIGGGGPKLGQPGVTGAHVPHIGGIIGQTSFPVRAVPTSTFIGAPRLHRGIAADEYPAILQEGEEVIPRRGRRQGGGNTINIYCWDTVTMEQFVWKNRNAFANANLGSMKSNHPSRRYDRNKR